MPKVRATHRQSRTVTGWDKSKPKLRGERERIHVRCGCRAFLDCKGLKYPFVAKRGNSCAVDCRGLRSAKARAAQHHHPKLVKKADRIGRAARCHWAR